MLSSNLGDSIMSHRRVFAMFLLTTTVIFGITKEGMSQLRRYSSPYVSPAGPTISPYLNLFRQDVGGIYDPYNQYVLPAQQAQSRLNQAMRQQQLEANQLRSNIGQLQGELKQIRETGAAPTGVGAKFMNHGQFFQSNLGANRPTPSSNRRK